MTSKLRIQIERHVAELTSLQESVTVRSSRRSSSSSSSSSLFLMGRLTYIPVVLSWYTV
jgi:hypothetical protein